MTENNDKPQNRHRKKVRPIALWVICSITFMLLVSMASFLFFRLKVVNALPTLSREDLKEYRSYYVLICDDTPFWKQVHEYAQKAGEKKNIWVDLISERLGERYSKEDLLRIAIEADVDAILLQGEDTAAVRKLIDEADARGICVVTIDTDCTESRRRSFIQAGSYNVGRLYGEQVLENLRDEDKNVLVVMDASGQGTSQNIIFYGIQDTVNAKRNMNITPMAVDAGDSFATEEDIRSLFMGNDALPDIFICLNEQSTVSVYQALVDYNRVGNIRLIGYFNSEAILNGIRQGVTEATVSVDTRGLGEYAVEAADEYLETGYVSDYYSVDSRLVNSSNYSDFIDSKETGE